jgi:multimeric flavodoxin WrbA
MNLIVISGGRNPEGQTASAAKALLAGARAAGAEGEIIHLPGLALERCRQCDEAGWGLCRQEGRCVIEDDIHDLIARIESSDAAVFATPVYYSDLAESLRALLDRLRRTTTNEAGKRRVAGKVAVGVCVAGGGGGGGPACAVSLEKVLRTCGFDVVDLVPARRQNLGFKLGVLEATGRWLAGGAPAEA